MKVVVGFAIGLLVTGWLVLGQWSYDHPTLAPARPLASPTPAGRPMLVQSGGYGMVGGAYLANSQHDLRTIEDVEQQESILPTPGLSIHEAVESAVVAENNSQCWWLDDGTRVTVYQAEGSDSLVAVTNGPVRGTTGWIESALIDRP